MLASFSKREEKHVGGWENVPFSLFYEEGRNFQQGETPRGGYVNWNIPH